MLYLVSLVKYIQTKIVYVNVFLVFSYCEFTHVSTLHGLKVHIVFVIIRVQPTKRYNACNICMVLSTWFTCIWLYYVYFGVRLDMKITSYKHKKSHCADKTVTRPCYLHNRIFYTSETVSLYWNEFFFRSHVSYTENAFLYIIVGICWFIASFICIYI